MKEQTHIDQSKPNELRNTAMSLGTTSEALKKAIQEVGNEIETVRKHLGLQRKNPYINRAYKGKFKR